jgi:alanine dehydrogenase
MTKKVTAIAYETVQLPDGRLVLLEPMSEISGKMAIQVAAQYLETSYGGRGVLMGGASGVPPCNVVIIGAGTVGLNAARAALGVGANVLVLNRGMKRLRSLSASLRNIRQGRLFTEILSPSSLETALKEADVVVGAVHSPGSQAPTLVSRELVSKMKPKSVIVDVAIDQGGIFETSRPTTHKDPIYVEEGVIHYCVPNMPGVVPHTSTIALTNVTLPYVLTLANFGFSNAIRRDSTLAKGVNVFAGYITTQGVAIAHGLKFRPLEELLSENKDKSNYLNPLFSNNL